MPINEYFPPRPLRPAPTVPSPSTRPTGMVSGLRAAAAFIGLSPDRLKILMNDGRLPFVQIGRRYYFRREALDNIGKVK